MSAQLLQIILTFLDRVQLNGQEADAMFVAKQQLRGMLHQAQQNEQGPQNAEGPVEMPPTVEAA